MLGGEGGGAGEEGIYSLTYHVLHAKCSPRLISIIILFSNVLIAISHKLREYRGNNYDKRDRGEHAPAEQERILISRICIKT